LVIANIRQKVIVLKQNLIATTMKIIKFVISFKEFFQIIIDPSIAFIARRSLKTVSQISNKPIK
jgi:hypothetical protein